MQFVRSPQAVTGHSQCKPERFYTKPGRFNCRFLSLALPNHLNNDCKSMQINKI